MLPAATLLVVMASKKHRMTKFAAEVPVVGGRKGCCGAFIISCVMSKVNMR